MTPAEQAAADAAFIAKIKTLTISAKGNGAGARASASKAGELPQVTCADCGKPMKVVAVPVLVEVATRTRRGGRPLPAQESFAA